MALARRAAGEVPSSSVDGYFTAQALRAGLLADVGRSSIPAVAAPPSSLIPAREALQRELQKERSRDDLVAQRRILEQEVRRERDLEGSAAVRHHDADRLAMPRGGAPLYPDADPRLTYYPTEGRAGERDGPVRGPYRGKVGFEARLPFDRRPEVGFIERLPRQVPHQRQEVGFVERLPLQVPHQRQEVGFVERLPLQVPHQRSEVGFFERMPLEAPHPRPEVGFVERLPLHTRHQRPDVGFIEPLPPQVVKRLSPPVSHRFHGVHLDERPASQPQPKPIARERKSGPHIRKWPPRRDITPTKGKAMRSGIKRKAESTAGAEDFHQPPAKKWKCALCKVFTTCEQGLKEHFEGKKHKAMEESLNDENPVTQDSVGSTSINTEKFKDFVKARETYKLMSGKKDVNTKEAKNPFWCDVCSVQCNSQIILNSHLGGKKHKLQLEESKEKPVMDDCKNKPMTMERTAAVQESDKEPAKDDKLVAGKGPEKKVSLANDNEKKKQPAKGDGKPVTDAKKITRAATKQKKVAVKVKKAKGETPKQPAREVAADEAMKTAD